MTTLTQLNIIKRAALDEVSRALARFVTEQCGGDTILPTGEIVRIIALPCAEVILTVTMGANDGYIVARSSFASVRPRVIDLMTIHWVDEVRDFICGEEAA